MIRNILRWLRRLYVHTIWFLQYIRCKCLKRANNQLTEIKLNDLGRVTILAPHADDEWVGCYSILTKMQDNLRVVYFNLYGDNHESNNIKTRNAEILASSSLHGFTLLNNYNYDVDALLEELSKCDTIFVPSPIDWHPEHRRVFSTLFAAYDRLSEEIRSQKKIYLYMVSVPFAKEISLACIPQSKMETINKWKMFLKIYPSQSNMPGFRYVLNNRLYSLNGSYSSEAFWHADYKGILEIYHHISDKSVEMQLSSLKQAINNIDKIHRLANKIIIWKKRIF